MGTYLFLDVVKRTLQHDRFRPRQAHLGQQRQQMRGNARSERMAPQVDRIVGDAGDVLVHGQRIVHDAQLGRRQVGRITVPTVVDCYHVIVQRP